MLFMRGMRNFFIFFPGFDFLERIGKIYWIEIFHFTEQNTFISLLILGGLQDITLQCFHLFIHKYMIDTITIINALLLFKLV